MRKAAWSCALCLCLAMIAGCGKGTETPTLTPEHIESLIDASAVADVLEVTSSRSLRATTLELHCSVSRAASIVVEFPSSGGTKTIEMEVSPPTAAIIVDGLDPKGGGKIVIRPKE